LKIMAELNPLAFTELLAEQGNEGLAPLLDEVGRGAWGGGFKGAGTGITGKTGHRIQAGRQGIGLVGPWGGLGATLGQFVKQLLVGGHHNLAVPMALGIKLTLPAHAPSQGWIQ
jgi:hypothetical protein